MNSVLFLSSCYMRGTVVGIFLIVPFDPNVSFNYSLE